MEEGKTFADWLFANNALILLWLYLMAISIGSIGK